MQFWCNPIRVPKQLHNLSHEATRLVRGANAIDLTTAGRARPPACCGFNGPRLQAVAANTSENWSSASIAPATDSAGVTTTPPRLSAP